MTSYFRPSSLNEALDILTAVPGARVIAGGTDWMIPARAGAALPAGLVNVFRLEELGGLVRTAKTLELGACVSMARLLKSRDVLEATPLLWKTADRFASPLVRARATIGGNLCNASPAADMSLALLASDASVTVASKKHRRTLAIEEFVLGPRKTALAADEMLVSISVPLKGKSATRFEKSGTRPALEISAAAVAFSATVSDGRLADVRIACGAVAAVPMRARRAEGLVEGKTLDAALIEACAREAALEVRPIDDLRATGQYRRRLVAAYVRRCLEMCSAEQGRPHAVAS
jgi:CO/xanthine dehydrogenase FAD-binding subunit